MAIIRSDPPENKTSIDENDVDRFLQELYQMDQEVVAHLKDPDNNPPPDYQRLVSTIQGLPERSDHSKVLAAKVSALKYKTYYFERSWRQIRSNVAHDAEMKRQRRSKGHVRRKESYFCAPTTTTQLETEKKGQKVTSMLYDMQKLKWKEHGVPTGEGLPESENSFNERIRETYQNLKDQGREDSEMVLTWNEETKRCDLIEDRRTHEHGTEPVVPLPDDPTEEDD